MHQAPGYLWLPRRHRIPSSEPGGGMRVEPEALPGPPGQLGVRPWEKSRLPALPALASVSPSVFGAGPQAHQLGFSRPGKASRFALGEPGGRTRSAGGQWWPGRFSSLTPSRLRGPNAPGCGGGWDTAPIAPSRPSPTPSPAGWGPPARAWPRGGRGWHGGGASRPGRGLGRGRGGPMSGAARAGGGTCARVRRAAGRRTQAEAGVARRPVGASRSGRGIGCGARVSGGC